MIEHPCARGLTTDCFKTYPTWARQALAYKLLHILLPKQLAKNLPRNLNQPLIPPGVPWTPGDPIPPGGIVPPGTTPTPPGTGATTPIFSAPWEPGPITTPKPPGPAPYDRGSLLGKQDGPISGLTWGDDVLYSMAAAIFYFDLNANIAAIDIKIGTIGTPTDDVVLEIYNMVAEWGPTSPVSGGMGVPKAASELPAFSISQQYMRFIFPSRPLLTSGNMYGVAFYRTGTADLLNCYRVGLGVVGTYPVYYKGTPARWDVSYDGLVNLKVWGFPL